MWFALPPSLASKHHGLYGSTSCCISHGPSQWEREIFDPPQLGDPSTDFRETWNIKLLPRQDPACKISGAYVDVGGLDKYPVWRMKVSVLFFVSSPRPQVAFLDTSQRSIRHYTSFPPRKCLFGLERLNLKFGPLYLKKRKNWDFKLAVNGKL